MTTAIEQMKDEIVKEFKELEDFLMLENKRIKDVLKEMPRKIIQWQMYYSFAKASEEYMEDRIERAKKLATENLRNNYKLELGWQEAKDYSINDKNVVALVDELNSIRTTINLVKGAVKSLDETKWLLKSYSDLIVRGAEDTII